MITFRMKHYPIFLAFILSKGLLGQTPGQNTGNEVDSNHQSSTIEVEMEDNIAQFLEMTDSLDRKNLRTTGYRIQIFSSSGPQAKQDALKNQASFLNLYSDYGAYTKWNYPNWVVRLGDYRTHLEALEFHNEIKSLYPASFIVKDEIKVD
ncbi:MAG: hypothetical protein WEC59_07175 [Salibacteraceae bacterium]